MNSSTALAVNWVLGRLRLGMSAAVNAPNLLAIV
jgi:hypothetical protein